MNDFKEYKAAFLEQNDLAHFGILGMRWGVRRYQNPDGTLTPAGKKRYDKYMERSGTYRAYSIYGKDEKIRKDTAKLADSYAKIAKKYGSETPEEREQYLELMKKREEESKNSNQEDKSEKMKQWEKENEENQKILQKEVYGASDKKFKSLCREYYKDMKKQGRTYNLTEDQFIDHMMDDGWQDDADDWYLRKYHQRSL